MRIREEELRIEAETNVTLVNPFYDIPGRPEIKRLDEERVFSRDGNYSNILRERGEKYYITLVEHDLRSIRDADGMLAVVTHNITLGTSMEMFYASYMLVDKPVYVVCEAPELAEHPWLKYCSIDIFKNWEDARVWLGEKYGRV